MSEQLMLNKKPIHLRLAFESDFESIWKIIKQIISNGDTYIFDPNSKSPDPQLLSHHDHEHCHKNHRQISIAQ